MTERDIYTQGRDRAKEMSRDERLMSVIKVINWIGFNPLCSLMLK